MHSPTLFVGGARKYEYKKMNSPAAKDGPTHTHTTLIRRVSSTGALVALVEAAGQRGGFEPTVTTRVKVLGPESDDRASHG